ncbi:bleomycin hydrolase [Klebsiella pneumoniae]|uniref:bleomycin hydrolase n=1 Tax=Klebsiella pneumoniae TaxID=573 RepID=UPI0025A26868|nr:bleomycin hydrolase [Klebsiella pneumoniae]MDM7040795.1 bleomycin hydrolase [Klebsiella pneumoniae]MDM7102278.1 bleomycin hydrolase [Klebsiella pneumoniae]MDM7106238.1 bleomycin hydrolase [Klebsiella pneumoniae]MDM7117460.1 bleomycin hydrolase [Klebsiella pneumoniae]MDM7125550.1 bleomycin hydrolase [Klebsiella pneumoniae]
MSNQTPTKASVQAEFEALVENDSFWSRFVGSQFVSMLALFITQIIYRCYQYADAALAEGFISTATRRSSILAAAETNGYVGSKPSPSTGPVEITASSPGAPGSIPQYTTFISDDQYPYMTMSECKFTEDGKATVEVAQLEIQELTYTVTAAKPFLEVVISKELTAVCHKMEVFVKIDGTNTLWQPSTMFRLANNNSEIYVEFYKPSEQLGVRFGDGQIGKIPPEGATITLRIWCTNGDITLVAGQTLTPVDDAAELANYISVKTMAPITNGTDAETTEVTRNRAQYYLAYDNQVVWGGDYTYFLIRNIPGMTWVTAWGEREQEKLDGALNVKNINNIFISGWHPQKTQEELEALVMDAFSTVPNQLNKVFTYTSVNKLPFRVELTGVISPSLTTATVLSELCAALEGRFGRDSTSFDPKSVGEYILIKKKDLWAYIEGLGYFHDFSLEFADWHESNGLFDFVYLDVENSIFDIDYEGADA